MLLAAWIVAGRLPGRPGAQPGIIRDAGHLAIPRRRLQRACLLSLALPSGSSSGRAGTGDSWRDAFPPGYRVAGSGTRRARGRPSSLDVGLAGGGRDRARGSRRSFAPSRRARSSSACHSWRWPPLRARCWPAATGRSAGRLTLSAGLLGRVDASARAGSTSSRTRGSRSRSTSSAGQQRDLGDGRRRRPADASRRGWRATSTSATRSGRRTARRSPMSGSRAARRSAEPATTTSGWRTPTARTREPSPTGPGWQWFPRWSPDGAWLEYTRRGRRRAVALERIRSARPSARGRRARSSPAQTRRAARGRRSGGCRSTAAAPPSAITDAAGDDRSGVVVA